MLRILILVWIGIVLGSFSSADGQILRRGRINSGDNSGTYRGNEPRFFSGPQRSAGLRNSAGQPLPNYRTGRNEHRPDDSAKPSFTPGSKTDPASPPKQIESTDNPATSATNQPPRVFVVFDPGTGRYYRMVRPTSQPQTAAQATQATFEQNHQPGQNVHDGKTRQAVGNAAVPKPANGTQPESLAGSQSVTQPQIQMKRILEPVTTTVITVQNVPAISPPVLTRQASAQDSTPILAGPESSQPVVEQTTAIKPEAIQVQEKFSVLEHVETLDKSK